MIPARPVHLPHLAPRCDPHMFLYGLAARTSRPASHMCHLNEQHAHMFFLCAALHRTHCPVASGPHLARGLICPVLSTRQGAAAFNQPLNFDTSSVTSMAYMFWVRSAPPRAPPSPAPRSPCAGLSFPEHIWPYLF